MTSTKYIWELLRLTQGWVFFWAFIDKVFGLGFTTEPDKAWLAGGSPTSGFLKFGTHGPFAELYQGLAGNLFVDWLFMLGLLAIGLALLLGIGVRIAGISGAIMFILMYSAVLPPEHDPLVDEHITGIIILIGITIIAPGTWIGLGRWWANTSLVKRFPWLR